MSKVKISEEDLLKKAQEKVKKIKQRIERKKSKKPVEFVKALEKVFGFKIGDSEMQKMVQEITKNKDNYLKYWFNKTSTTTTSATSQVKK